jgi:GntR family transcriptional regulator
MSRKPQWQIVADALRSKIQDGTYPPGSRLPTQVETAVQFSVSPETARRAYEQLAREGLTSAPPRKGTIVNKTNKLRRLASNLSTPGELRGLPADMAQAGIEYSVVAAREDRPAPDLVAEILGVEPGTELLVRDRIQSGDGEVYQHAASWFLPAIAEALPILREEVTGPGGYLQRFEDFGLTVSQRNEAIPDLATSEECRVLGLTAPAAVLRVTRVTRDQNGRALEVTLIVMTGRNALVYDS